MSDLFTSSRQKGPINVAGVSWQRPWIRFIGGSAGDIGLYGDGSDNDVTLSGTSNVLSRDMYYNNLTFEANATLDVNSFRVFVRQKLIMNDGSKFVNVGEDGKDWDVLAVGGDGGVGANSNVLGSGSDGGGAGWSSGAIDGNGLSGSAQSNSLGGSGGAGGASDGTYSQGNGGTAGALNNSQGGVMAGNAYPILFRGSGAYAITTRVNGGCGGGGGASDINDVTAGGGGGGGGVIFVAARTVITLGTCTFSTTGGAGGSAGFDCGGGGGGGGGWCLLVTDSHSDSFTVTFDVTGGTGGAGSGVGSDGTDGSDGRSFLITGDDP